MLKVLFLAEAVLGVAYGVTLIVLPSQLLTLYGAKTVTPSATYMAQLLGATLIGLAIVAWSARDYADSPVRRMIVRSFFTLETSRLIRHTTERSDGRRERHRLVPGRPDRPVRHRVRLLRGQAVCARVRGHGVATVAGTGTSLYPLGRAERLPSRKTLGCLHAAEL